MIASIGLLVFMQDGFRILFGEQGVTFIENPLRDRECGRWRGITLTFAQLAVLVVTLLIFVALHLFTTRTRIGVALARDSIQSAAWPRASASTRSSVRYLNFGIGSALAEVAGGLIALLNNFVDPTIGYVVSYKALAIIVLGGLGSVRGTLVASLFLALVESYGTIFIGSYLNRDAIAFLALILVLMARPRALPESARHERLHDQPVVDRWYQRDAGGQPQYYQRFLRAD